MHAKSDIGAVIDIHSSGAQRKECHARSTDVPLNSVFKSAQGFPGCTQWGQMCAAYGEKLEESWKA